MKYDSIALPISFTFYRIPVEWHVSLEKQPVPNGVPDFWFQGTLLDRPISQLDPEAARLSFLRLQSYRCDDDFVEPDFLEPVLKFLNSVGSFMEDRPFRPGRSKTFDLPKGSDSFGLDDCAVPKLRLQSRSISGYLSRLQNFMLHDSSFSHFLDIGLRGTRRGPEPLVITTNFWDAALAITLVDRIQKAKIRACAQCGAPFALHTKHAKKFCSWSCAHRATVRNSRLKKEISLGKKQRHVAGGR